ncbi:MAG: glycosyltransferase family 2 protein [Candidatus Micrarchaeota archaeon]
MAALDIKTVFEYAAAFLSLYSIVLLAVVLLQHKGRLGGNPRPPKRLPKLTVIIPAYNEEKTIAKTIESVLASKYPKDSLQVIVVNDGSTDGTRRIAESFRKRGVLVLSKENGGKGAALNYAIRRATGEFIATLDSDSYIEKDSLAKMFGHFNRPDVAAVISVMKVWRQETFWQKFQGVEYVVMVFIRQLQSFLDSVSVTPGPLSIFRARIFAEIGGFDEHNILEDQEMALRIQKHNYRIKCSTNAVVYTDAPRTFRELLQQRIRWYRGGVRNFFSHYYLMSPKYGDFGIFAMPFAILSILLVIFMLALVAYLLVTGVTLAAFQVYANYGLDAVVYGVNGLQLIMLALLAIVGLFSYASLKYFQSEYINAPMLLFYILFYSPIVLIFWAASFLQEIRLAKMKW